jgi:type II secretory pathway pseudopilin PulG
MKTSMHHSRSESGFALIEAIVSAAVLAIVALAVLSGMDGATFSSAREKARAVAGALAEQDQERMRSYRFDTLATIPQALPVTLDEVTYNIKSQAEWVNDNAGAVPACGETNQKQAEYLRITSTVTSKIVGSRIPPVKLESLVAPSVKYAQGHGTLAVRVQDRNGVGVPGIKVYATDADGNALTPTDTNPQGCALFRSVKIGDYTIKLNTSGYLSKAGNQLYTQGATVNPNYINVVSMTYDRAIRMAITVKTLKPGETLTTTSTGQLSAAANVSDAAADAAVLRTFPVVNSAATTVPLFPFKDSPYSWFTGKCGYESPIKASGGYSDYFTAFNPKAAVQGDPDAPIQPQQATVFQPAFNLRVLRDSQGLMTAASRVNVYVWLVKPGTITDSCSDLQKAPMVLKAWPATYGATLPAGATGSTNFVAQNTTAFDAGMPFGTYQICLEDTVKGKTYKTNGTTRPHYDNTGPSGPTASGATKTVELAPGTSSWGTPSTC